MCRGGSESAGWRQAVAERAGGQQHRSAAFCTPGAHRGTLTRGTSCLSMAGECEGQSQWDCKLVQCRLGAQKSVRGRRQRRGAQWRASGIVYSSHIPQRQFSYLDPARCGGRALQPRQLQVATAAPPTLPSALGTVLGASERLRLANGRLRGGSRVGTAQHGTVRWPSSPSTRRSRQFLPLLIVARALALNRQRQQPMSRSGGPLGPGPQAASAAPQAALHQENDPLRDGWARYVAFTSEQISRRPLRRCTALFSPSVLNASSPLHLLAPLSRRCRRGSQALHCPPPLPRLLRGAVLTQVAMLWRCCLGDSQLVNPGRLLGSTPSFPSLPHAGCGRLWPAGYRR